MSVNLDSGNSQGRLLLSARDAAAALSISTSQFWNLHRARKLPLPVHLGAKAPRWRASDLECWLAAGWPNADTWEKLRKEGRSW